MTKTLWHITSSLDGYLAPPDDSVEWMFGHGSADPLGTETMLRTGAVLSGRRGYDLGNRQTPGERQLYGGKLHVPMFVLTHRPDDVPDDPDVTFLSGTVPEAVATARAAAGDGDVGIFGANLAGQVIAAGLLDEIVVHQVPVLLGGGVRLFDGGSMVRLTKTRCDDQGQITSLCFTVDRSAAVGQR